MAQANSDLANAFPTAVRKDALIAISELPEPFIQSHTPFSVLVAGEVVSIPSRVYYDPAQIDGLPLTSLQKELVDCLLTRHHNGWVRQKHLQRIVCSPNFWIPPFVIQLVGEYVIEILQVIHNNLSNLNVAIYEQFVRSNPQFIELTEQRVISYWNQDHRRPGWERTAIYGRDEYVGFQLLRFFKALGRNGGTT